MEDCPISSLKQVISKPAACHDLSHIRSGQIPHYYLNIVNSDTIFKGFLSLINEDTPAGIILEFKLRNH
jgi:hypothetical protein